MKVKYLGEQKYFKTSTNTGIFYEFIDNVCDVENKQDIEDFSNNSMYEIESEKKKSKKGSEDNGL